MNQVVLNSKLDENSNPKEPKSKLDLGAVLLTKFDQFTFCGVKSGDFTNFFFFKHKSRIPFHCTVEEFIDW